MTSEHLFRSDIVVRLPDGNWRYLRMWEMIGHRQSGTCLFHDLPDSAALTEQEALDVAIGAGLQYEGDNKILGEWECQAVRH